MLAYHKKLRGVGHVYQCLADLIIGSKHTIKWLEASKHALGGGFSPDRLKCRVLLI